MEQHELIVYVTCAACGGMAGMTRFLSSPQRWKWRTIATFVLFGAIASVVVIGIIYGSDADENPWKVIAISLAIGFVQEEGARFLQLVVRQVAGGGEKDGDLYDQRRKQINE